MNTIENHLKTIYPNQFEYTLNEINDLIKKYAFVSPKSYPRLSEKDTMLITYADSINGDNYSLSSFIEFLNTYIHKRISIIHFLPFYPFSSDDGFSVVDYYTLRKDIGSWDNIKSLGTKYDMMFDAVVNHISKESNWFKEWTEGNKEYRNYFIQKENNFNYSNVVRPRKSPLFYEYNQGSKTIKLWATFSEDQIDLNFRNPQVLLEIIEVILFYVSKGARLIRLDAIGFLWKESGTTCMHLKETHAVVKLIKQVISKVTANVLLITETNVPHRENISYFGNDDEADLVYQFTLPPLALYSIITSSTGKLTKWLKSLEEESIGNNTYFNFLASHDGIGLRGIEGILNETERDILINNTIDNKGYLSYKRNSDGTETVYEMNITYFDAVKKQGATKNENYKRFLVTQVLLLSLKGLPGIYIHSLLSTQNDITAVEESGIRRRVNRHKYQLEEISKCMEDENRNQILETILSLIEIRKSSKAFNPYGIQETLSANDKLVVFNRIFENHLIKVVINFSNKEIIARDIAGFDIITKQEIKNIYILKPYEYLWIKSKRKCL